MVKITRIGSSLGILLDKAVVQKIYHLGVGDEVDIDYTFDGIIIKPVEVKHE